MTFFLKTYFRLENENHTFIQECNEMKQTIDTLTQQKMFYEKKCKNMENEVKVRIEIRYYLVSIFYFKRRKNMESKK